MQLEIVTPDRKVIIGETSDVVIPALQGELEALPGHAPYLALLGTGILSFVHQGKQTRLMVSGGYVEIDRDRVTLMAEQAALADEVTREDANKSLYDAEQKLKQLGPVSLEDESFKELRADVERSAAKLTLLR